MMLFVRWGVAWSVLLAVGCSGGREAVRPEDQAAKAGADSNILPARNPAERVTEYDLNQDKTPDVWSYTLTSTVDGQPTDRLVRKELDINWDGRVDIVRYYGEDEQLEREAYDLDFDGKLDQVNFFEKNVVVRKERDLNYDGRTDLWIYYEKGKIARKERDTNADGKIDYWEYWEADQVDRIGEDLDGDGQVDKWTKNPESTEG